MILIIALYNRSLNEKAGIMFNIYCEKYAKMSFLSITIFDLIA